MDTEEKLDGIDLAIGILGEEIISMSRFENDPIMQDMVSQLMFVVSELRRIEKRLKGIRVVKDKNIAEDV